MMRLPAAGSYSEMEKRNPVGVRSDLLRRGMIIGRVEQLIVVAPMDDPGPDGTAHFAVRGPGVGGKFKLVRTLPKDEWNVVGYDPVFGDASSVVAVGEKQVRHPPGNGSARAHARGT